MGCGGILLVVLRQFQGRRFAYSDKYQVWYNVIRVRSVASFSSASSLPGRNNRFQRTASIVLVRFEHLSAGKLYVINFQSSIFDTAASNLQLHTAFAHVPRRARSTPNATDQASAQRCRKHHPHGDQNQCNQTSNIGTPYHPIKVPSLFLRPSPSPPPKKNHTSKRPPPRRERRPRP